MARTGEYHPDGTVHFLTPIGRETGSASFVMAVHRNPSDEWSAPEVIFSNPTRGGTSVASLVFDSQGNMHAFLLGDAANGRQGWHVSYSSAGAWAQAEIVIDQGMVNGKLVVGSDDTLYIAWIDSNRQAWMLTQKSPDRQWQKPIDITPEGRFHVYFGGMLVDQSDTQHFV